MEERARDSVGFSHMAALATLSVIVLIGVSAWQIHQIFVRGNPVSAENRANSSLTERASTPYEGVNWQAPIADATTTSDPDGIANIEGNVARALLDSYAMLSEAGIYTPEDGEKIAGDIADSLRASVSYKTYSTSDIKKDPNTSYDRMLTYRNDLRIALEPLLGNPGYELGLFANYIESRDPKYTDLLKTAAKNYSVSVAQAADITVPEDAANEHVGILNSLSEFGTILEKMAGHADDAFAAVALLQTYNAGETNLLTSFNSLALYYTSKQP